MKDLEKEYRRVSYILGEVCDYPECIEQGECDYSHENQPTCLHSLMSDALHLIEEQHKLLKEHKHGETFTVIDTKTGKEADEYAIALYEDWAKHLCYCDMEGWAIENDGTLLLVDECGRFAYADRERFKVVWDA